MTSLFLPEKIIEEYDKLVENKVIANRSEAFRQAVIEYLVKLKQTVLEEGKK